jgi:hypothetical protein
VTKHKLLRIDATVLSNEACDQYPNVDGPFSHFRPASEQCHNVARTSATGYDLTMVKKLPEDFDWQAFTPEDSPLTPQQFMADARQKDLSTAKLKAGDLAYNFSSLVYDYSDGTAKDTGRTFDLLEVAQEKPVALIFGSYT